MKLADMRHAKPKGKDGPRTPAWSGEEEGPRVTIDHDRMQKIGMSKPPATGDEYHIQGHARVVRSKELPSDGGQKGPRHEVAIVIHHMGAEPKRAGDGKSVRDNIEEAAQEIDKRDGTTARTDKQIPATGEGGGGVAVRSYERRSRTGGGVAVRSYERRRQ
jgi:hypothetical protein